MQQPKKTDYTLNVYNALKDKVQGFDKTEEQFRSELQNPEYAAKVHKALSDKVTGFNKPLDQFVTLTTVKKKESTSPAPKENSESVGDPVTSSGTVKSNLAPDPFGRTSTVNPTGQKPTMEAEYDKFKSSTSISETRIAELAQEVNDIAEAKGVANNIKSAAKSAWNKAADVFTAIGSFGSETEAVNGVKFDADPLQSEKTEAEKIIKKAKLEAKNNDKPEPVFTPEDVTRIAKEIKIQKLIKSEEETLEREYLLEAQNTVDEKGINNKTKLLSFAAKNYKTVSDKDKLLLTKSNIVRDALTASVSEMTELNKKAAEYKKSGQEIPNEFIDEYNAAAGKYKSLSTEALKTHTEYTSNKENLGDLSENIDVFKRNYGWMENFYGNLEVGLGELTKGAVGVVDFGLGVKNAVVGTSQSDEILRLKSREINKGLAADQKNTQEKIAKPITVDGINSGADFGKWLVNIGAQQTPILALVATGAPGIAMIGATSTGAKYSEMQIEEAEGNGFYSDNEMLGVAAGFGVTETVSAMVDKVLLGNAARVVRSATSGERNMMAQGIARQLLDNTKAIGGNVAKGVLYEGTEEGTVQLAQNALDIYVLGKNKGLLDGVKDAAAAGAALGAAIPLAAGSYRIASDISKTYSTDGKIQSTSAEILKLEKQLDNPNITESSRTIITEQLSAAKTKVEGLISKVAGDVSTLSNAQFQEIGRLEKAQANIKNNVQEIKSDSNLDEDMKKQLLGNLKSEFDANNQRRIDLLERGAAVQLEQMPDVVQISLKDEAARELMKEQNPDGTKDITLNDNEISKRAIAIHNRKMEASRNRQPSTETANEAPQTESSQNQTTQPQAENQETVGEVEINNTPYTEIDIRRTRNGYEGDFLNDYDYLAEGSEHTVYRSKDGKSVVKIGEPYNADETFNQRVKDATDINTLLGDGSLRVIGIYRSANGTRNPIYQQNFIEGETLSSDEVATHLESNGFTRSGKDKFTITVNGKTFEISDTSDNFIRTSSGKVVAIDAGIIEITNETTQSQNPTVDGNVQPGTEIVGENRNTVEQNPAAEVVSESANGGAIENNIEVKPIVVGKNSYVFENNEWKATDQDGNPKSKSLGKRKAVRKGEVVTKNVVNKAIPDKVLDAHADNFDFTAGKKAVDEGKINSVITWEEDIAEHSDSPIEVAEALLHVRSTDAREGLDNTSIAIAEAIGYKGVERASFVQRVGKKGIKDTPGSIAFQYFAKKGQGAPLDIIAQNAEIAIYGDTDNDNPRITEDDVLDFIVSNPSGTDYFLNGPKKSKIDALKIAFEHLTGLPANDKYLNKAIAQAQEQDNFLNNFASSMDVLSEQELLSLQDEIDQFNKENNERQENSNGNGTQGDTVTDSETSPVESNNTENGREENSGVEESTELNDESESQTQGFAGQGDNKRDLTGQGRIRDLISRQRKFRKLWNETFSSNAGLQDRIAETERSRNRDISAFTDALDYETKLFKKLLSGVKKSAPKDYNKNALAINDYLSGDSNAVPFLNADQKKQLDYFRERIDILSETIMSKLEGKVDDIRTRIATSTSPVAIASMTESMTRTQKLIDTIRDNKGTYLNRSYQIFVDESYSNIISQRTGEMNKLSREKISNAVNYLVREEGYSKQDAEEYIADYLDSIKKAKSDVNFVSSGKANAPFLKKRKDLPVEFRELLGESKDPIYNFVNTVYKLSGYVANLEYQDRMRTTLLDTGVGKTSPEQGYTKLTSDGDGWQTLSDIYVPNEVAEALESLAPLKRVDSGFYQAWIQMAAATKVGKTILSPTTTFRNIYSGVFLGINAGHFFLMSPKYTAQAFQQGFGTTKSQTELKAERQKLLKLGVLGDGSNSGELMAIVNDFSKETDRMISQNKFQFAFDKLKQFYAFGDDFYKTVGFYMEKDRFISAGMDAAEAEVKAAERIRNSYPTYSYLPRNFQRLRRLPVLGTFVSFPYEMIRTTRNNMMYIAEDFKAGRTKMAAQRTAGMIVANAMLFGLSAFTRSLIGFDDEDDDAVRDMLPEWQKNSKLIYTGTKNGKPTFIDGTALFPSEVVMKPLSILYEDRAGRDFDDKLLTATYEAVGPYVSLDISFKTLVNLIRNKDEYDQAIYKGDNFGEGAVNDPDNIANYYLKQAGPGAYNNITEFMRANEVMPETFGDKFASYGKEYTNKEAVLGLLGFRISTINYSNGITSFGYGVKDAYDIDRKAMVDKIKSSEKLTPESVAKIAKDYKEANKEAQAKIENIIVAGKKLGMSVEDIQGALNRSGYSKEDAKLLAIGGKPFAKPIAPASIKKQIEKLQVSYGAEKAKPLIENFKRNLRLLEAELVKINKEDRATNRKVLEDYYNNRRK